MEENKLEKEYREIFDNVNASDNLREKVLNLKPQKRAVTPFKAVIGSVAAAVMVFCAVHEYTFEPDTDGVISETAVSTQIPKSEIAPAVTTKETTKKTTKEVAPKTKTTAKPVQSEQVSVPVAVSEETEKAVEAPKTTSSTENEKIMAYSEDTDSEAKVLPRSGGGGVQTYATIGDTTEVWEINRYFDYIGTDITSKINGSYTGPEAFEFEMSEDGVPLDDTTVFTFICKNGGTVRITVSKHSLFDNDKNNVITVAGSGYNGYKISNGVYYMVYTTGLTERETSAITDIL